MKLFYLDGKKAGEAQLLLPPGISIGREMDNDMILTSEGCSRYHAKIEFSDEGWKIKDLGSTNGTKVNGSKITDQVLLKEGDKIKIGEHTLLFGEKIYTDTELKSQIAPGSSETSTSDKASHSAPTLTEMEPQKKTEPPHDKKSFFDKFFSDKEKAPPLKETESAKQGGKVDFFGNKPLDSGKEIKRVNIFFYVIIILIAVIFIALFVLLEKILTENAQKEQNKPAIVQKSGMPLTVIYEKQTISPDNIFRYELLIKGGKIRVTRDDLKCKFRIQKEKLISNEQLDELENEIKQTDFMNISEPQAGISPDENDEQKILTIAYGRQLNSIRIKNTFEPASFKDVTTFLEDFSRTVLNLPPVSLTAEEMRQEARINFDKAEMLFANYQAKNTNLKDAIKRYQAVVDLLEFFEPKPAMYEKAYTQLIEAKRILESQIKAHEKNFQHHKGLGDLAKAKEEYLKIMEKIDPDDKIHQDARKTVLLIEKYLSDQQKKKK